MAASPFAFLRGPAGLMAFDLARTPVTGIRAQICGDAHAANFGLYGDARGGLVVDLNDFDETVTGPWERDLKRLATSLVLAGREAGADEDTCRAAAYDAVGAHRHTMRLLVKPPALDAWNAIADEQLALPGEGGPPLGARAASGHRRLRRAARRHEGRRVVLGQQRMQVVGDTLLSWTSVEGRPYQVRQFRNRKGGVDPAALAVDRIDDYGRMTGALPARAHSHSAAPPDRRPLRQERRAGRGRGRVCRCLRRPHRGRPRRAGEGRTRRGGSQPRKGCDVRRGAAGQGGDGARARGRGRGPWAPAVVDLPDRADGGLG